MALLAAAIIGAAVIGGIASAYASNQSADANQDAIDAQLKAQGVQESERKRISKLISELQDPEYSRKLSKEEIDSLFTYFPKISAYIAESAPEALPYIASIAPKTIDRIKEEVPQVEQIIREEAPKMVEKTTNAKEAQEAQRAALQALRKVGTEGDMISKSEQARARETVATQEAGQRGALTEEMARRGQSGGGQELLMKLAGQQSSQQNMANMAMQSQEAAIRNRLGALAQGAGIGGQIYGQEMALANKNTDIINQYNQRNTAYSRQQEAKRIADQNAYQTRNANYARGLEAANTGILNQAAQDETNYARGQANTQWSANQAYNQRETANRNAFNRYSDTVQNQANEAQDREKRNMQLAERDRMDSLERERYNRDVGKVQLEQGQAGQVAADANNAARIAQQQAANQAQGAANQAKFFTDMANTGVQAYGAYQQGQISDLDYQIREAELRKLRGY